MTKRKLTSAQLDVQIKALAQQLHWAAEWIRDSAEQYNKEQDEDKDGASYVLGSKETVGHLFSCWLVQVAGFDSFETGAARDILFDNPAKTARGWERKIRMMVFEAKPLYAMRKC